jgi:hypothetical protein
MTVSSRGLVPAAGREHRRDLFAVERAMNPLVDPGRIVEAVYNCAGSERDQWEPWMAKLGLKQILGSILVWVLFLPVILATGSKAFRLSVYDGTVLGVPTFLAMVVALLLIFMVSMWIFSAAAFDETDGKGDDQ